MAGNLNIKNANGKTLTIQNPDTNNADIVIDGSKIASTVSPVLTGTPTAPTQTAQDNSTKVATTAYVDGKMVRGTAITASGTSIDFTGIPSWAKRVTIMFNEVSTNGSSPICIRLGDSGGIESTGYVGLAGCGTSVGYLYNSTTEFPLTSGSTYNATHNINGNVEISNINSNAWTLSGNIVTAVFYAMSLAGSKTLSGTLDRVRITTVNGTDTFDAGTINILYEG